MNSFLFWVTYCGVLKSTTKPRKEKKANNKDKAIMSSVKMTATTFNEISMIFIYIGLSVWGSFFVDVAVMILRTREIASRR